jgi:hypothetical protein
MRSSAASPQIHQAEKVVDQAARQLLRGEAEWPDVDPEAMSWENAASEVLQRFFYSHVFATFAQVRSWSQFGVRKLKNVLGQMEGDGRLRAKQVEGLVVAADDDL